MLQTVYILGAVETSLKGVAVGPLVDPVIQCVSEVVFTVPEHWRIRVIHVAVCCIAACYLLKI